MKFFYYWPEKRKDLTVTADTRDKALEKLEKITGKVWYQIDDHVKSDLQLKSLKLFDNLTDREEHLIQQ